MNAKYGSREACPGTSELPVVGTAVIAQHIAEYYRRRAARGIPVKSFAGFRGKCRFCGKTCAIRSDGTVGAHVDNTGGGEERARRAERDAERFARARTDLLELHTELRETGD